MADFVCIPIPEEVLPKLYRRAHERKNGEAVHQGKHYFVDSRFPAIENYKNSYVGEWAFSQFLEREGITDYEYNVTYTTVDGCDFKVKDKTIDIKSSRYIGTFFQTYENPNFKALLVENQLNRHESDIYVFTYMHEDHKNVFIAGWATKDDIKDWDTQQMEQGIARCTPLKNLRQIHSLPTYLNERTKETNTSTNQSIN